MVLRVAGLEKKYGPVHAVDHLDFEVAAGEVYALLGPNGAGKTTTLRSIATLTRPDAGSIHIDGVSVTDDPIRARALLAWVPAESGLPPRLTPIEVVALFARIQGVGRPTDRAREMLESLGATPYSETPCGELSTGMKRRVVLARALVHGPRLLLLDEPTDGLDVHGRRQVLTLVQAQAEQGAAVVLSSHILTEVERVAHRVGILHGGRLVAEGSREELLARTGAPTLDDAFLELCR